MSTTASAVIAAACAMAQDRTRAFGDGQLGGVSLLDQPDDYTQALTIALRVFDGDRPNRRLVHHTVTSAAFRFVLAGAGALAGLTGLDAWVDGASQVAAVWWPYDTTSRGLAPLDPHTWRVLEEPSLTVLELLEVTPSSGVLRLEFDRPHVVGSTTATTSVRAGDVQALATVTAVKILEMAAARAVQNTGQTGLPTDVVDRRSQSDQFASRAKVLWQTYQAMVGQRATEDVGPASAIGEMDVDTGHPWGMLWHPRSRR